MLVITANMHYSMLLNFTEEILDAIWGDHVRATVSEKFVERKIVQEVRNLRAALLPTSF